MTADNFSLTKPAVIDVIDRRYRRRLLMLKRSSNTLSAGDTAPHFALPAADGKTFRLSDFLGKPLVIVFIRGTW